MKNQKGQKIITAVMLIFSVVIAAASVVLLILYSKQKQENDQMQQQILEMQSMQELILTEREALASEKEQLDQKITEILEQLWTKEETLDQQDTVIEDLNALIAEIQTEIGRTESRAADLEAEIERLEQRNEISLLVAEKLRESRDSAHAETEELNRKIEILQQAVKRYESEIQKIEESQPEEITPETPPEPELPETEQKLFDLLRYGAPMRYVKLDDGSIISEYPHLEYAYYDFTTGKSVTYNADQIIYAASVIKAPFVYAVIREIEEFEIRKRDYDSEGNPLWDEDGNPLFEGDHPNYDENGNLILLPGEEKYNLDEIWIFDPETMMEEGSGEIMSKPAGFRLTWRELIEYALLYSDNIAFAQIRQRFGYTSFYQLVGELGIQGTATGFMNLSADDCVRFLTVMHDYMASGSKYGLWMKDCMTRSKHLVILARHYPEGTCAHKYGWDIDAYHDAAVIFDEHPYAVVVMSDLHDGGDVVNAFFGEIAAATKEIHAQQYTE